MTKKKLKPRLKEFWMEPRPKGLEKIGSKWGCYILNKDGWWRPNPNYDQTGT
jgi:hypothetical protein